MSPDHAMTSHPHTREYKVNIYNAETAAVQWATDVNVVANRHGLPVHRAMRCLELMRNPAGITTAGETCRITNTRTKPKRILLT